MRERENDKFIVTEWDKKSQNKKKRTGQMKSDIKVESSGKIQKVKRNTMVRNRSVKWLKIGS